MSRIAIEGLSAAYGRVPVLHDIDLEVPDGTVLTLLGPSGSGKTSLLRTVAGFLDPVSGTVRAGDRVLVGGGQRPVPPEDRNLAMVFQHHAVWPHMTVGQNVAYPLKRRKVGRAERRERIEHALEVVGLTAYADRRPDTLSGGQRQRVALARAIVARPEALLLDEALSALDEPLRAALRLTLRQLVDTEGLTVIQVTHDRDEALALADRIAVLHDGRVAQVGSPSELVDAPASASVATFLHDAALLDGQVSADGTFADTTGTLTVSPDRQTAPAGPVRGPATLALLPQGLEVCAPGTGDGPPAVVEAVLYGRSGSTVVCRWLGQQVRALTSTDPSADHPVAPGQDVGLRIRHAAVYPA
ncbi:ABC transporter ATP-binding protein [Ornithinicoccus hortensis]|uniref:ABC-type quaternary amine transporter n=1 Tax=Ornithinicoccus hortensis TaxID=82346 RepID=A0A542YUG7_9MICO|nr:ABC transporter ATP-binding protein [Ornithinicoccus hortensis]TQL51732.1 iron(III) transport system ATP-binding protein [Ornithinicoccus hortensis]